MIVNMYSVYDKVAGTYGEPFFVQKHEIAVRRFNFLMSKSPLIASDCQLYCVGYFSIDTGCAYGFDKPEFVSNYEVPNYDQVQ